MTRKSGDTKSGLGSATTSAAGSAAGAVVGGAVGGPLGALLGSALGTSVKKALDGALDAIGERRHARLKWVLAYAAKQADLDPEELAARMQQDPEREELFVRVLQAAQASATAEKLIGLAVSLARGVQSESSDEDALEVGFVRVLGDLDTAHLTLLRAFTQTSNELGLGDGSADFDKPLDSLNLGQLKIAFPELALLLDPTLSALEQHGLVRPLGAASAPTYGALGSAASWGLTPFGEAFIERMALVSEMLDKP
jgi:hypothetical protein